MSVGVNEETPPCLERDRIIFLGTRLLENRLFRKRCTEKYLSPKHDTNIIVDRQPIYQAISVRFSKFNFFFFFASRSIRSMRLRFPWTLSPSHSRVVPIRLSCCFRDTVLTRPLRVIVCFANNNVFTST